MDYPITQEESDAIKAVREAVKKLPRSIWIETDDDDGEMRFWKRVNPSESKQASTVFRHRSLKN